MESTIDVTVAAIIADSDRFLLVEEIVGGERVFNQPAGHLEAGESLLEAVARETREETGFDFTPSYLVGVYLWRCDEASRSFLRVCFAGSAAPPPAVPTLDVGIVAVHWLTRDELLSPRRALRSPLVMRSIDDYRANARYPLDCLSHLVDGPARETKLA